MARSLEHQVKGKFNSSLQSTLEIVVGRYINEVFSIVRFSLNSKDSMN